MRRRDIRADSYRIISMNDNVLQNLLYSKQDDENSMQDKLLMWFDNQHQCKVVDII